MSAYRILMICVGALAFTSARADDAKFSMECNGIPMQVTHKINAATGKGRVESEPMQFNINQPPTGARVVYLDYKTQGRCTIEIDADHMFIADSYRAEPTGGDSEIIKNDPAFGTSWPIERIASVSASQQAVERAEWTVTPLFPHKATVGYRFIASYRDAK